MALNNDGGAVHLQELQPQATPTKEALQDEGGIAFPQEPLPVVMLPPYRLDPRRRFVDDADTQLFETFVHLQPREHFSLTHLVVFEFNYFKC